MSEAKTAVERLRSMTVFHQPTRGFGQKSKNRVNRFKTLCFKTKRLMGFRDWLICLASNRRVTSCLAIGDRVAGLLT